MLETIPGLNMVTHFVLDYMHLGLLEVAKKFLLALKTGVLRLEEVEVV